MAITLDPGSVNSWILGKLLEIMARPERRASSRDRVVLKSKPQQASLIPMLGEAGVITITWRNPDSRREWLTFQITEAGAEWLELHRQSIVDRIADNRDAARAASNQHVADVNSLPWVHNPDRRLGEY